jgi:hypothetical protein
MTRKRQDPDLVLHLQGLKVPDGALGSEDLVQLAKLIKGQSNCSWLLG